MTETAVALFNCLAISWWRMQAKIFESREKHVPQVENNIGQKSLRCCAFARACAFGISPTAKSSDKVGDVIVMCSLVIFLKKIRVVFEHYHPYSVPPILEMEQ